MLMNFDLVLWKAVLVSLGLAVLFVTSLYIWPQKYHRNHPTCVKQRFDNNLNFLLCLFDIMRKMNKNRTIEANIVYLPLQSSSF